MILGKGDSVHKNPATGGKLGGPWYEINPRREREDRLDKASETMKMMGFSLTYKQSETVTWS